MIDISLGKNPELYINGFDSCMQLLKNIDTTSYQYPSTPTNFHVYSDIKNEKELMVIKSFLATQNLKHATLNLWTDVDLSSNELVEPFLDKIQTRIYNPIKEAQDTPLEGKTRHLESKDFKHWMQSGILRFLVMYKYGGIWIDMDMVLLRDFAPILDQEFAYMWSDCIDFGREKGENSSGPCAALVSGFKRSQFMSLCMEEILKTQIKPNSACFDHELLARVYRRYKFTVFPSCFFNTEWQMGDMGPVINKKIVDGWFQKNEYSSNLFLEAFAWHWHNSGQGHKTIEKDCKFDRLMTLTDQRLKERHII